MLEGLARDDDIGAFGRNFPPIVRIAQDDIDVVACGKIDSDIFPRRQGEERPIGSINVLAAQIENDERFRAPILKIIAPESRHFVERALVHGVAVNAACRSFATALSKSVLLSRRAIQS